MLRGPANREIFVADGVTAEHLAVLLYLPLRQVVLPLSQDGVLVDLLQSDHPAITAHQEDVLQLLIKGLIFVEVQRLISKVEKIEAVGVRQEQFVFFLLKANLEMRN